MPTTSSADAPNTAVTGKLYAAVAAVLICGALAIAGTELGLFGLTILFKPLATLLLLVVVGRPVTHYARIVWAGIFFSLAGDVALLSDADLAFEIGLSAFLLAHVSYVFANLSVARWSRHVLVVALVFIASTALLLRLARPTSVILQEATLVYGTAITLMVISASATIGGPLGWSRLAAIGAVLFYVSDSSLALNRFHASIPHVSFLTLGVYWLGQLGICLAARGPVFKPAAAPPATVPAAETML
jgi:alkenylglycerophosphocholine hydrolase